MSNNIILDLDHTLVHSVYFPMTLDKEDRCGKNGVLLETGHVCFKRPNVDLFLRWCFNKYDKVVVWSAGTDWYVNHVIDMLFEWCDFDLILTRDHCVEFKKDFSQNNVYEALLDIDINITTDNVVFIDDKTHRIQNYSNIDVISIKPFQSKWKDLIYNGKKRKRPIREKDTHLLELRRSNKLN